MHKTSRDNKAEVAETPMGVKRLRDRLTDFEQLNEGRDGALWEAMGKYLREAMVDMTDMTQLDVNMSPENLSIEVRSRQLASEFIAMILEDVENSGKKISSLHDELMQVKEKSLDDSIELSKEEVADLESASY